MSIPEFTPPSREPFIHEGLCYILLSNGRVAICDVADYPLVAVRKLWTYSCGYAMYRDHSKPNKPAVFLHQVLNPEWNMTDHRNHNKLDNRRKNLRECVHRQNDLNKKSHSDSASAYKGVSWDKYRRKWKAQISANGRHTFIGRFSTEVEAARAYDEQATELHGEFAWLNFPEVTVNEN